jgi:hypothetical protein
MEVIKQIVSTEGSDISQLDLEYKKIEDLEPLLPLLG